MTDRHSGYVVILDGEMREDDAQATIAALRQIKGVVDVKPVVRGINDFVAAVQERHRIMKAIYEIFKDLA